jgi:hypothetical protein
VPPAAAAATTTTSRTRRAHVDAVVELEQEALVVLVVDVHKPLQQRQSLARVEVEHVDVHHGRIASP